jgi:thiosulfate/3-mercaptopyruvate sulfurtransferase
LECGQGIYPGKFTANLLASFDEVKKMVGAQIAGAQNFVPLQLLDARGEGRFRGEDENLDPPGGHIPGAVNCPYPNHFKSDGTFKSAQELRAMYRHLEGKALIASCGSGVTACHLILALEIAGIRNVRLFVESFSGWSRTPGLPVEK